MTSASSIALEVETDSLPGENSESRCRLSSLVADGEPRLEPGEFYLA